MAVAELCEYLAQTPGKLAKRAAMAALLQRFLSDSPENRADSSYGSSDAGSVALWLAGRPFPESDPRDLNVGGASLSKVIREVAEASDVELGAAYRRHGDLGAAACDVLKERASKRPGAQAAAALTIAGVRDALNAIAAARGPAAKQALVKELLQRATPLEAKYLIKLMTGDMRTGVKESLVEEAIAAAFDAPLQDVRHAGMLTGNLLEVVARAQQGTLHTAQMRLFHALGFMLATPAENVEAALERFTTEPSVGVDAADVHRSEDAPQEVQIHIHAEDKYDGIRAQLHCGDPQQPARVAIFTRTREDMTESFPELGAWFGAVDQPMILDGEILAWDFEADQALPFTALQPRISRKRVSDEMQRANPVVFLAFDVLYAEGRLMLDEPLTARRGTLEAIVQRELARPRSSAPARAEVQSALFAEPANPVDPGPALQQRIRLGPVFSPRTAEELDEAFFAARARRNEGLMLKAPGSKYRPGRRGSAWVKLKRELATLDVVVTAAEYGNGRRAQFLSDYTFAVRDGDELKNVGKAYSGVTDAEIVELTRTFKELTIEDFGHSRLVEPKVVMEVAFNNVMRSDRHNSGFALRFPRILRLRPDKPVEEVDTLARVEEIYNEQPDKPGE